MTRLELEHIIRAGAAIAEDSHLVIVGSQAILGQYPDAPVELLISMEADVYPKHVPENAIVIDGAIGELSMFHTTFGYYAHGVTPETATLPRGWQERIIPVCNVNTRGFTGECLEANDLAVSKLAAGREKDLAFVQILLTEHLADDALLRARIDEVPDISEESRQSMRQRLQRALSSRKERLPPSSHEKPTRPRA